MPDLVNGATGVGTPESVTQARAEWLAAGFVAANFFPLTGQGNKTVTGQFADPTFNTPLTPGVCQLTTTRVYVNAN